MNDDYEPRPPTWFDRLWRWLMCNKHDDHEVLPDRWPEIVATRERKEKSERRGYQTPDERCAELQATIWHLESLLAVLARRLGGGLIVVEADEMYRDAVGVRGLEITTTPMPFPKVKGKDLGASFADDKPTWPIGRWTAGIDPPCVESHDEPISPDWPPVVPGTFPMSH